jgi:hypothetical protein
MPRAATNVSDMVLRIEQNTQLTNFFTTRAWIMRLLEDQIYLSRSYIKHGAE